jgi:hypothetical protein
MIQYYMTFMFTTTKTHVFFLLLIFSLFRPINSWAQQSVGQKDKIVHIAANLVVDPADSLLRIVDRAKANGANTVIYSDSKLNIYGINGTAGNKWDSEMVKFVSGVKSRGMDLRLMTISMGFGGAVIASDPNLTTGYPIVDQKMIANNGVLTPMSSSNLVNGGFENYSGNTVTGTFQDAIGQRTFVDTNIKRSGNASFRAEGKDGQPSRLITTFGVKPFHQYTFTCWIKTNNLSADNLLVILRDNNNLDRNLSNLSISLPRTDGTRSYFNRPNNLTIDWTEVRIAFNSLNATTVNLGLSVFGGRSGTIWWDDVAIIDSPFLNWINRDDLPVSISNTNGQAIRFGTDVQLPVDPKLGQIGYAGNYGTNHAAPVVNILNENTVKQGDTVKVSGYHAMVTASGQISCSWNSPAVYNRMRQIHAKLQTDFQPDGYLLNYSEIRTGGWEPSDLQYGTSGAALAASLRRAYTDLFEVAPNAKHYFWSDMIDPNHNARANYYQINNTLDQSWVTLDTSRVTLATWWEGSKIIDTAPRSLAFFSNLGFKQVVGAFYDEDVTTNYNSWQGAATGVDKVEGSIYATWIDDFSKLEAFGDLWWSGVDALDSLTGPAQVSPGGTYTVEVAYSARKASEIAVVFQRNQVPTTTYGEARVSVPEGSGKVSVQMVIDSTTPGADNLYKWQAFLIAQTAGVIDSLASASQTGVSCKVVNVKTVYLLKNKASALYVRPQNTDDNARIVVAANDGSDWFKWDKIATDNGNFYLKNVQTGKYFRPETSADASLMQQKPTSSNGWWTQWSQVTSSDGITVHLINRNTGKHIRPQNGNVNSFVELRPSSWTGDWTRWSFEATTDTTIVANTTARIKAEDDLANINTNENIITLYPNPAQDRINIVDVENNKSYQVYDLMGRKVLFSKEASIDISNLVRGVYIVMIGTRKIRFTKE